MADGVIGWDAVLEGHLAAEQCKVLASARGSMAGAGGLGSNCAVFLARTGIRDFVIADPDVVALSNLNRQHFFPRHLGLPKVEALGAVLRELNPSVILRLDWVMIVLLPAVALYLFYTVFRLRRDRVLFDNKLLYPGGCTKDDCLDPDGFIDYILPRLIIIGAAFLLCGAFTALVVFIPAMDTLVCNILEIVFPIAAIAWYSFVSRHAAREYWGV